MNQEELDEKIRIYSQKYILPMYLKDELGNLMFAATLTLIEYKKRYFAITAAHSIPNNYDFNLGIFVHGENILSFLTSVHRFDSSSNLDLLILDFGDQFYEDRYYYKLDEEYSLELEQFHMNAFYWHGFPARQAKNFYKKSAENMIKNSLKNGLFTYAKSLLIEIPFKESLDLSSDTIQGSFNLKNIKYNKEGKKSMGYSLQGMSGGALYLHRKLFFPLENPFYFIGMGIEHRKDNTIIGISRNIIVNKLDKISETLISMSLKLVEI